MVHGVYDMSAVENPKQMAKHCVDYLHILNRRLKSGPKPHAGAAGALSASHPDAHAPPRRGKGLPPPDARDAPPPGGGGIKMVPGHSGAPTDVLHVRRPRLSAAGLVFKPVVRCFAHAFASKMQGVAAIVTGELRARRTVRLPGAEAPEEGVGHTGRRVLAHSVPLDGRVMEWEQPRASSIRVWKLPEMPAGFYNITRHHAAAGAEEGPAKLDVSRAESPTLCPPSPRDSRGAFAAAAEGYQANKAKAIYGSSFRLG
ncbi:MAG: hypothetical protein J3K34DRAFT_411440 [Monoraphidium minutum]|nr:MAG: hypothetical protein J3K34DRAFT_411440 [Monoraphidium minutum]